MNLILTKSRPNERKLPLLMSLIALAAVGLFAWAEYARLSVAPLIAVAGALAAAYITHRTARQIVRLRDDAERVGSNELARATVHHELEDRLRHAQKLEAMGRLAGGIAHDFNNLLTVIRNYTEFVRDELPKGSKVAPDIDQILSATDRASTLTGQLLAFSRDEIVAPRELDVNSIVRDAEKMLRRVVPSNIALDTSLDGDLGTIMADRCQMEQILLNLALNAADAMPDGGTLSVRTQRIQLDESFSLKDEPVRPGCYASIVVTDTGSGIDSDTMVRIFDPFFTTKEPGKGTGLGLASVHGIVKQSGGHIRVYSELGHGTTFKVYLPEIGDEDCEPGELAALDADVVVSETILLADDDEQTREVTRRILAARGYTVIEAGDASDALRVARSHPGPMHLVLSDIMLPGTSGGELVDGLCRVRPRISVLLMAGYPGEEMERRRLLDGAVGFIEKPFTRESLLDRVRKAIEAAPARSAA